MAIKTNANHTAQTTVNAGNTALAVGSGSLPVFATPMLAALMERAAAECIGPQLEDGQTSVGTHIAVEHLAATPMGMQVTATATVTGVQNRQIHFALEARDEAGLVGRGTHTRVVVQARQFMEKAEAKGAPHSGSSTD